MSNDTKPSNPKAAFGDAKLPIGLVPATAIAEEALAFLDGALKYGTVNWREVGVKASTYRHAHDRHMTLWWEGEECDPVTGVSHLAYARACLAIIMDAKAHGMLTDDRPKSGGYAAHLASLTPVVEKLKALHAGKTPRHYTIADNTPLPAPPAGAMSPEAFTPVTPSPIGPHWMVGHANQQKFGGF